MGSDVHDEVGVDTLGGDAVAFVIGDDESVAHLDQYRLEREAVRRCFGIGGDGVVTDEDETLGLVGLGQDHFSGEDDRVPLTIDAGVGADDLDGVVLVAPFEQTLQDRCAVGAVGFTGSLHHSIIERRSLAHFIILYPVPLIDGCSAGQVTIGRQTLTEVRLMLADDLELQVLRTVYIGEVHIGILAELAGYSAERYDR